MRSSSPTMANASPTMANSSLARVGRPAHGARAWLLRAALGLAGLCLAGSSLAGCGGSAENFSVQVRLTSIEAGAIELLTVSFRPQAGASLFSEPAREHLGGSMTTESNAAGDLVLRLSGNYIREHLQTSEDGRDLIFDLPVYNFEAAIDESPRMLGVIDRAGQGIAQGSAFVPAFPAMETRAIELAISCTAGGAAGCAAL